MSARAGLRRWAHAARLAVLAARVVLALATRGVFALALLVALAITCARPAEAEVSLQAQLQSSRIALGETAVLDVVVDGGSGDVSEPVIELPDGVERLGVSRSQSFSWMNGRTATRTRFQVELGANREGRFTIGPIRVRVVAQWYESSSVILVVAATRESTPGGGSGRLAQLLVDVTPREPHVGEPTILRVRLVQRAPLAEDPDYTPPATPGFWSEKSTAPTSYYADQGGTRVLVTETRTRLYPLAAGVAHIGEAAAVLTLSLPATSGGPLDWVTGGGMHRQVAVRSAPINVAVRALPARAPNGFEGAVGRYTAAWSADRRQTTLDVPVTAWLDVRGTGNLPLLRTPSLASIDADVFSSSIQDSLAPPGAIADGRRRFQWTVLPRRVGTLRLEPPDVVWFDHTTGRFERLQAEPIDIEVGPPLHGSSRAGTAWPAVFASHPVDPGARAASPGLLALAGIGLGLGIRGARAARAPKAGRAAPSGWLQGLKATHGAAFWAAAARACDELAARGEDVSAWRNEVEKARFSGSNLGEEALRRQLVDRVQATAPTMRSSAPAWARAIAALVAGLALLVLGLPRPGPGTATQQSLRADRAASAGELEAASRGWRALWRSGSRAPGLAARLAWLSERTGDVANASAWVLRGDRGEPRDPSLSWVIANVRDAGGLAGYAKPRLPVRSLEWGGAALIVALGLGFATRRFAIALALAALAVAAAPSIDAWRAARTTRAVVRVPVMLLGESVELVAGQIVSMRGGEGGRVRVEVGSGIGGTVPASALIAGDGTP